MIITNLVGFHEFLMSIYLFSFFILLMDKPVHFSGRSYVVGYGKNSPKQPHHAASSCPNRPAPCGWQEFSKNAPNPQILYGALVSGPDEVDSFKDCREEYAYTEVTLDYNAGFTSVLAGLLQLQLKNVG